MIYIILLYLYYIFIHIYTLYVYICTICIYIYIYYIYIYIYIYYIYSGFFKTDSCYTGFIFWQINIMLVWLKRYRILKIVS